LYNVFSIILLDLILFLDSHYFKPDKIHKKYLESLIYKHGGAVHRYLNVLPKSCYKCSYIITDTPSQTCNFLLGLSLGIPAYHHRCIEHAISQVSYDNIYICCFKIFSCLFFLYLKYN